MILKIQQNNITVKTFKQMVNVSPVFFKFLQFTFTFPSMYMYMYIVLNNTHTYSNYNMWSVQFTLTIITYVLHFLYNQQNIMYSV